jgi:hypothetical protein
MMSFGLLEKFLEACPDDFWVSEWGTWTVWQQYYHALNIVALFVPPDMKEPLCADVPPDVAGLKTVGKNPISKEQAKACLAAAKSHLEAYLGSLTDATLAEINQKVKAIINHEWSHAATLLTIAGHNEYHLGIFDAGLRERKLPGIF